MLKIRKYFILTVTLLAAVCAVLGLAACDDEHTHEWGEWQTVTAATCTAEGSEQRACTGCEETETRAIQKLPHTATQVAAVDATCLTAGHTAGTKCSVCGQTLSGLDEIAALGHTVVAYGTDRPATCTEAGEKAGEWCSVCHHVVKEKETIPALGHEKQAPQHVEENGRHYHTVSCSRCEQQLSKEECDFDVVTTAATCTEAEHREYTCKGCVYTYERDEGEPLGHSYGEVEHVKTPTCTDQGLDRKTCTRQGCGDVQDTILAMSEHTVVEFGENRDATCTEAGSKKGERCSVCQHVIKEEETIPALGHEIEEGLRQIEENGTHYHAGYCKRCEQPIEKEECVFDVVKTEATCTAAEHHVHTCPTCNYTYEHDEGSALGHNFGGWHFDVDAYDASLRDADGATTVVRQHRRVCSNPGHVADPEFPEVEACGKTADGTVEATCTTSGYTNYKCTVCEDTYTGDKVNATGHTFKRDGSGKLVLTYEKYFDMDTHYKECETCGQKSYFSCRYESAKFLAADCEQGKRKLYTCTDCGHENTVETGDPLGHAYGAWTHDDTTSGSDSKHYRICGRAGCGHRDEAACVMQSSDIAATCQKPGTAIQICRDCKYNEQGGEIAQLEHDVTGQPYFTERANGRHYQVCKRAGCGARVYGDCAYTEEFTPASCTGDEKTTFTCPTCGDKYTVVTQNSAGHRITEHTASDKYSHTGRCDACKETVAVPHDFSHSNICAVCGADGLTYTFEAGSDNTKARVSRTVRDGRVYYINTPKIVIPEKVNIDGYGEVTVVGIGTDAFFGNRYITEVELPLSLTYIGYNAFQGCTSLADVHFAGHAAGEPDVADCKLNRIENGAFKGCIALTNAILPNTLQYIGQEAFRGCTFLDDIEIPELVTEIEDHAFMDTKYFNDPGHWAGDVLYIGPHLIRARTSLSGSYKVNENVVSISAEAFMDCKYLTGVELPATLKAIDRDAFKGCDTLQSVKFDGTFAEYLGIRFDNNEASPMHVATELTIAGAVGTPQIPADATVIPAGAFRGSDIQSIVIPASVTSIGAYAFQGCAHLTSITFERGSKLISIGKDVVAGTAFYDTAANWTDGVLYLKDADGEAVALVAAKEAELANYVKYEGEAFDGSAKQAVIASGTRAVAPEAFKGFTLLRYVEVPDTVVYFGEQVFVGCTGLARVNFRGTGKSWFCYSSQLARVHADTYVYGGADGTAYDIQRRAADMFKTYTLQWKRTGA